MTTLHTIAKLTLTTLTAELKDLQIRLVQREYILKTQLAHIDAIVNGPSVRLFYRFDKNIKDAIRDRKQSFRIDRDELLAAIKHKKGQINQKKNDILAMELEMAQAVIPALNIWSLFGIKPTERYLQAGIDFEADRKAARARMMARQAARQADFDAFMSK